MNVKNLTKIPPEGRKRDWKGTDSLHRVNNLKKTC